MNLKVLTENRSCIFIYVFIVLSFLYMSQRRSSNVKILIKFNNNTAWRVLVVYVFAQSHPHAIDNLKYFIQTAVRESDPVDYYFILQQINQMNISETILPKLPRNAQYIHHENKCFDFGTIGWFFSKYTYGNPYKNDGNSNGTNKIDLKVYKYFIFMNSSTRGPYFPPYYLTLASLYEKRLGKKFYWYSIFTERITEQVKLVGPLISCERSPHIQNYIAATDFIGLSAVLKSDGKTGVFDCHQTFDDAIDNGEIGFSRRLLEKGYMIDSLMRKYQKLNFNAPQNRRCNSKKNPHLINGVDGISIDPYEMVFIKFNYKRNDIEAATRAKIYEKWSEEVRNNIDKYSL